MSENRYRTKKLRFVLFVFIIPVVFTSSGIILIILRMLIYNSLKSQVLSVEPGSMCYEMFRKTPFNTYLDVYFFNWTNPEQFNDPKIKPKFEEIGPFRFREEIEKTNLTFHENSTVSYNRTRRWYFVDGYTAYDLNTPITSINPVVVAVAYIIRHESMWIKKLFAIGIRSLLGQMSLTQTVGNVFINGYEDPFINLGRILPFVKSKVPPMEKFAWFYKRNGSNEWDGRFNMGTGSQKVFGRLYNYNNMDHTPFYEDVCGDIRGTAGEFFPEGLKKAPLNLFNPEMCRTIVFDYVEDERQNLINGYKFNLGDHFLDNGTIHPENKCYCSGDCIPSGMLNISLCRYGSPGFVSLPHFYKADPYYINLVDGLKPTERHDFHMIIEPTTGLPLKVSARIQINLLVKNIPGIGLLENREDVFFPIFWLEQVVKLPSTYSLGVLILLWLKEICVVTGLLLISAGIFMMSYKTYRIYTKPFLNPKNKHRIKELVPLNNGKDDTKS